MTTEVVRLHVPGIHCEGWLPPIRLAVRRLHGTGRVSGDARSRMLSVEYDPALTAPPSIQEALRGIGYDSAVVTWAVPGGGEPADPERPSPRGSNFTEVQPQAPASSGDRPSWYPLSGSAPITCLLTSSGVPG